MMCKNPAKKLACGDLFRRKLKKCFCASAETPRPAGKADGYEQKLEGLWPL